MVGTLVMAPKSVTFRRHDHLVSVLFGDLLSHSYNITFSMFLDLVILGLNCCSIIAGQFWNIPIDVEMYTGPLSDGSSRDDTYILTVNYPNSPLRRFLAYLHPRTWDKRKDEYCLYAGSTQGGRIFELKSPNDPVIEGRYSEYIVAGPYNTEFVYTHFEVSECN